jgi:hypothetical protein
VRRVQSVEQMHRRTRASLWHTSISVKTLVRRCTCSLLHKAVQFTSSTSACSGTCCCCYYYYSKGGGLSNTFGFSKFFDMSQQFIKGFCTRISSDVFYLVARRGPTR